jgi:hypothetical protein
MINPRDEFIIDLSTSCTKEEAVSKLLGYRTGPIQPKVDLKEGLLQKNLWEFREARRMDYIDKVKEPILMYTETEKAMEYAEAIKHVDAIIEKAFTYEPLAKLAN